VGPGACFVNDPWPKSTTRRNLKGKRWVVGRGAAIGANATILSDVHIGAHAMVGAGAVVTKTVPRYAVVWGNPAKIVGFACPCGHVERGGNVLAGEDELRCPGCGKALRARTARGRKKEVAAL